MMHTKQIEDIITTGLRGLCVNCVHAPDCVYHHTAEKVIIQCEMHSADPEAGESWRSTSGLCKTCELAAGCKLTLRFTGAWHCEEYS